MHHLFCQLASGRDAGGPGQRPSHAVQRDGAVFDVATRRVVAVLAGATGAQGRAVRRCDLPGNLLGAGRPASQARGGAGGGVAAVADAAAGGVGGGSARGGRGAGAVPQIPAAAAVRGATAAARPRGAKIGFQGEFCISEYGTSWLRCVDYYKLCYCYYICLRGKQTKRRKIMLFRSFSDGKFHFDSSDIASTRPP